MARKKCSICGYIENVKKNNNTCSICEGDLKPIKISSKRKEKQCKSCRKIKKVKENVTKCSICGGELENIKTSSKRKNNHCLHSHQKPRHA